MPKFMKNQAIELIDSGIETYLLALYGLTIPDIRTRKRQESKYAPIMGLFGTATELLIKACLVQGKGNAAMYKNEDTNSNIYKVGYEVLKEFRKDLKNAESEISFIWKNENDYAEQQERLIFYLNKFQLLQDLRAKGLHAGIGCSRDVAVATANDVYDFICLLSQGKRLKAYIKNIPAPETTVKDREIIIEDLSRRLTSKKSLEDKVGLLKNMYLVLPYIPDIEPEWINRFEKMTVTPPTVEDVNYLVKSLSEAHSIYLLKGRGGKEGVPVKIEQHNPNALPIDVQYIKRTLSSIPDQFHNDILTANTRFEQKRLDLPIDDFLIDLFALGLRTSKVLVDDMKLTAQQAWPFIASAFSTQGTPRPCMEFLAECDEYDNLISFLKTAKEIGNGYFRRRADTLIQLVRAVKTRKTACLGDAEDKIFKEIVPFSKDVSREHDNPFTPQIIKKYSLSEDSANIIQQYISGNMQAGIAVATILKKNNLSTDEKAAVKLLMRECCNYKNRNGLVAVLRCDGMSGYHSQARKYMFFTDFIEFYPGTIG